MIVATFKEFPIFNFDMDIIKYKLKTYNEFTKKRNTEELSCDFVYVNQADDMHTWFVQ